MYIYSSDTKTDFLCKIVLKSGSLKSCPFHASNHMYDVQSSNGTDSVEENMSCKRDPHTWYQLTHE